MGLEKYSGFSAATRGVHIAKMARDCVNDPMVANVPGFNDKIFEKKMVDVGWIRSQAWCSYFAELIWREAYKQDLFVLKMLDKCFSGSATETYKRFDTSIGFETSPVPMAGAIAVWRYGNGWTGHAGIVEKILSESAFASIEGQSANGLIEELKLVIKKRKTNAVYQPTGLNLVGFILPY